VREPLPLADATERVAPASRPENQPTFEGPIDPPSAAQSLQRSEIAQPTKMVQRINRIHPVDSASIIVPNGSHPQPSR
jgi:hypothetical protein